MVNPYKRIVIRKKEEWSTDICYNIEELQNHYVQWKKPNAKDQVLYDSSYEIFRKVKFIETESRLMFAWGRKWERKVSANGHENLFVVSEML